MTSFETVGDFDDDIVVMIGDAPVSASLFDHFNPLIVTKDVSFFRQGERVTDLPCVFISMPANADLSLASNGVVAYPDDIFVDYKHGRVLHFHNDASSFWPTVLAD